MGGHDGRFLEDHSNLYIFRQQQMMNNVQGNQFHPNLPLPPMNANNNMANKMYQKNSGKRSTRYDASESLICDVELGGQQDYQLNHAPPYIMNHPKSMPIPQHSLDNRNLNNNNSHGDNFPPHHQGLRQVSSLDMLCSLDVVKFPNSESDENLHQFTSVNYPWSSEGLEMNTGNFSRGPSSLYLDGIASNQSNDMSSNTLSNSDVLPRNSSMSHSFADFTVALWPSINNLAAAAEAVSNATSENQSNTLENNDTRPSSRNDNLKVEIKREKNASGEHASNVADVGVSIEDGAALKSKRPFQQDSKAASSMNAMNASHSSSHPSKKIRNNTESNELDVYTNSDSHDGYDVGYSLDEEPPPMTLSKLQDNRDDNSNSSSLQSKRGQPNLEKSQSSSTGTFSDGRSTSSDTKSNKLSNINNNDASVNDATNTSRARLQHANMIMPASSDSTKMTRNSSVENFW
jgi:hypothetical protein